MDELMRQLRNFGYKGTIFVLFVFMVISAVLLVELAGVNAIHRQKQPELMPAEAIFTKEEACNLLSENVLLLRNSEELSSCLAFEEFRVILDDMKVGYKEVDLAVDQVPLISDYSEVIVLISDLSPMDTAVVTLTDWVYSGGKAYFPLTLETNIYSATIMQMLGVDDVSSDYYTVESIYVDEKYMIGGGRAFAVTDPFDCARTVVLSSENTEVFAAADTPDGVPLVWRTQYGEGTFVVSNIGIYEKAMRGFYAASYSLLADVCAYPVINASVFYLDDFPSQIPSGYNQYIMRDYQTTIREFYINVWWPDMMNFGDKYGIKYTGLAIESYDDNVDGKLVATPDTGTFLNFGNMLLRQGGELGYHGYNHQPLTLGKDYLDLYDYKTWASEQAMKTAFDALVEFCDSLFPDTEFALYVPPSNLLDEAGRTFLLTHYPRIRTISGIYFEDAEYEDLDFGCLQEFSVDKNGIVDQPRVISGFILDNFQNIVAISELNMHFVNSHFTHPDDALDEERGAKLGWAVLKQRFDNFLSWMYTAAPGLRNLTGTEASGAIQRYVAAVPHTTVYEDRVEIVIDNFYDEVYLLVRFNEKEPSETKGGALTHVTGDLYLLRATENFVDITLK